MEHLKNIRKLDPTGERSHCVQMIEWFDYHGHVCIVSELLGKNVYKFMQKNRNMPYVLDDVQLILYQLTQGIEFLHDNQIIHTDIKLENIMFVDSSYKKWYNLKTNQYTRRPKNIHIKIIDLGSAVGVDHYHYRTVTTSCYRAPETILQVTFGFDLKLTLS